VVFKASIPGQSIFCGGRNSANSGSSVTYSGKVGSSVGVWDTTESDVEHLGPQTPYTLSGLMVYLNAAPGAGTSHTISGRINALDPSNGPSVTIADTSQGPTSDTRSMQLQPGLRWALKSTPANSPNARNVYWGIGATVGSCSGGGQIVVEADPPDGEEFTGTLIDYRAWVELSFDDQIRQLGIDALNVLAGRTLPLVIEYGDIERHLSGRKSAYQMGSCVLRVDDSSRLLSTLEAAQATQYWYNREVTIYLASKATIEANGTPHVLMRGLWRGFSTSGLSASITVSDILGSEFSPFNLEREIPDRVIDVTTFGTTCPEASRGLPVPIIYGHHSDRALTSGNAVSSVVAGQPVAPLSAPTGVSVSLVSGTPTNGHNGRQYSYAVSFTVNGLHTEWSVVVAQPNTPTTVNQLSWNTPPAGTSEIHIARGWSPNFRHTFAYVSTNEHNPSYTGIFSLPANSTSFIDYWPDIEERSADSSDGVWTLSGALQNFVVYVYAERADGTFSAPGISNSISIAPILEGPSSSRVNPQRDITLTWSAYTGAVNYHLLVYMDWWANTSGTYSAYHIVPGTSTSYTVPVPPRGTVVSVSLPVVTAIPAGRIPTIHVGEEDIGGTLYQRLLVCGHAIQHIETIYEEVPSQTPQLPGTPPLPPVWQPIPVSVFGATWLAPGFAGWPFATTYRDLAGQWFTIIYTTLNPPPPTRVDLCAIEDVGDSSGNTIKASTRVVNHLFKNWFLPDANTSYRSGSWLSPKTFDNGDPVVNTQSLSDVETIQVARIGGEGYELAVYIGAFISLRDVLGRVYENANIRIGQNQHGQVFFWDLDEWQDTSSARVVTDVRDIVAETDIDRRLDEMANRWIFSWGYRPSDGSFDTPTDILDDTTAIANNRDVVAKGQREFFYVNHQASAYDVILRELIWGSEPPRYVRVTCTLRQVAVKIGDVIVVTDYQGVGAAGWNGRRLAVLGMIVRLGSLDEAPSVVLECVDIERILTDLVVRVPAGQLSFTGQTPSSLAIASIAGTLSFTGLAPTVIRT
jgi:hypothetical protein